MKTLTSQDVLKAYANKGYLLNALPYQMNIFAIRTKDAEANTFNDHVGLLFKDEKGGTQLRIWNSTTDAGMYYRLNPINVDGTAVICPGQYPNCYKVGRHKDYEAIEQVGKMKYIRDNNRNKILDWVYNAVGAKFVWAINKTNIHHAGVDSKLVDKWSAGCIVFGKLADFTTFMSLIKCSTEQYKHPNSFDLTLFEEKDFE